MKKPNTDFYSVTALKMCGSKKEETGVGEAALMGALMTADEAWSGPKISISIVRRIPET